MKMLTEKHTTRRTGLQTGLTSLIVILFIFSVPLSALASENGDIKALQSLGKAFTKVAQKAKPAVVGIKAQRTVPEGRPGRQFNEPFDEEFFEKFFGPYHRQPQPQPRRRPSPRPVQGSGFIVSEDGYILTNNHVVRDSETITVKFDDGRELEAELIGTDPGSEVAVIKVDAEDLAYLELGESDALEVGEWVLAIGNPFGLSHTVTQGIVSAKGRSGFQLAEYENFIQTSAAINFGNSGGPLINLEGKVIGINTAIIGGGGNIGIGFAVPVNMAKNVYDQLREGGSVSRGVLGVYIRDLDSDLAEMLGIKDLKGVIITEVVEDSAADKAGIKRYDVVLEFNGGEVQKANDFRNRVAMLKPNTEVEVVILRDGKKKNITAQLGESSAVKKAASTRSKAVEDIGLTVENLTDELAQRLGYEDLTGVLVREVEPDSPADKKGIKPGALIVEVNREKVSNKKEFAEAIEKAVEKGKAMLLINDRGYSQVVALRLPKKD